ncbi:MAG TPA: hypothetical protein VFI82_06695 [Terriglobales bacterium]|nr:hypothetical protein [Terriglobales bacterium]
MTENESVWRRPVVQVLLGVVIILAIDALVVAILVYASRLQALIMIAAVFIGFLQWLYVYPLARKVRRTHDIMARAMTGAAIVLTLVNVAGCFMLGELWRNPVR